MGLLQSAARTILVIDVLFLVLLGFSFLYLEPGTSSYVVALITLVPIVLTLIASLLVIRFDWEPFE